MAGKNLVRIISQKEGDSQVSIEKYCTDEQWKEMIVSMELLGYTELSEDKQLSLLYSLSNHPSRHYRAVVIPKRTGGVRHLMIPDSTLRAVQKRILKNVLSGLTVSPFTYSYRKGIGVKDNAAVHIGQEKLLKLDIYDFFGSITSLFPAPVRGLLTSLCCLKGRLPQGAPTSPTVSNLVMRPFDEYIGAWCEVRGIRYSRYCDDMTFSGSFHAGEVIRKVQGFLGGMGMRLNDKKTGVYLRNRRQEVTGIAVNEKMQLPKEKRRELRRDCYYCRRFGVGSHMERQGIQGSSEHFVQVLLGKIEYLLSINPEDKEFKEQRQYFRELLKAMKNGEGQMAASLGYKGKEG